MSNSGVTFNSRYKTFTVDSRLRYFKPHSSEIERTFAEEIVEGLDRKSKYINPKFFYDPAGSELFEEICSIPEYYLTKTETEILEGLDGELAGILTEHLKSNAGHGRDRKEESCTQGIRLVELGSGSSVKTRLVLQVLFGVQDKVEYFPIDISDIITESSERLLADYENLKITGIIDTYEGGLEFLRTYDDRQTSLIMFLGSSYGNLAPENGKKFLQKIRSSMNPGDLFLIGLDAVKSASMLELAYNDSVGATARFNLNVLSRINSELDADFDTENFAHRAVYNHDVERIEMYLESLCDQSVTISKSGLVLKLHRGERIHTENSYKYRPSEVRRMLESVGFEYRRMWTDESGHFMLVLVTVS